MNKTAHLILLSLVFLGCSDKELIKEYYEDGILKATGPMENGLKDGLWVTYFTSGDTALTENYRNGELNGETRSYDIDGHLNYIKQFSDGAEHGKYVRYYKNGQLHSTGHRIKWKYHGEAKVYHSNGQLGSLTVFNMDTPVVVKNYYENGQLKMESEDILNGETSFYDSLGILTLRILSEDARVIDTLWNSAL